MPKRSELQNSKLRALYSAFPSAQMLFAAYNRDLQIQLIGKCSHEELASNESIPTLAEVSSLYTEINALNWLKIQFGTISDFAGASTKMNDLQLNVLAKLVLGKYYFLNLAEICYFIGRFNSACYTEFYGSVDPMKIMKALSQYENERLIDIERAEGRKKVEEPNESFEKNPSRKDYLAIKQLAEDGNETAKLLLFPPEKRDRELTKEEIEEIYKLIQNA